MALLAWCCQQWLLPLHEQAMAQQAPLRAAFCGLTSSPAVVARLLHSAPPELLAAIKRSGKPLSASDVCSGCASGHTPVAAGLPASPSLILVSLRSVIVSALPQGSASVTWLSFFARGPPRF